MLVLEKLREHGEKGRIALVNREKQLTDIGRGPHPRSPLWREGDGFPLLPTGDIEVRTCLCTH